LDADFVKNWNLLDHVVEQLEYSAQEALFKECLKLAQSAIPFDSITDFDLYDRQKRQENSGTNEIRIGNCRQIYKFYASGIGTEKNAEEALKWLKKAARAGSLESAASVQNVHEVFGLEFKPDEELQRPILVAALHGGIGALRTTKEFNLFGQFDQKDVDQWSFEANILLRKLPGTNSTIAMKDPALFKRQISTCLRKASAQIEEIIFTTNRDNLLHFCTIGRAHPDILENLLVQHKMDVNSTNSLGQTPLILACRSGVAHNILKMLGHGADAKIVDHSSFNSLHYLVSSQLPDSELANIYSEVVRHGVNVNAINTKSMVQGNLTSGTPLHGAVMSNNFLAVQVLLRLGASPTSLMSNDPRLAFTPIDIAAGRAQSDILKALLDAAPGYDCNQTRSDDGNTLLSSAIGATVIGHMELHGAKFSENLLKTVDILIPRTSVKFLNRWKQPLLPCAVMSGKTYLVQHLIDTKVVGEKEINEQWEGLSPLEIAIQRRHREIFSLLLDHGADSTSRKSLYWCARMRGLDLSYAQELIARGTRGGPFILYTAITHRYFALAAFLLERDHSLNDCLIWGETPCTVFSQILCDGADLDILDYVLELGDELQGDFGIHKAYHGCILHAMSESLINRHDSLATRQIFHKVLQKYSESSFVNFTGEGRKAHPMGSPLHCAVANINVEAVQELLFAGAKTRLCNARGQTSLEMLNEMILQESQKSSPIERLRRMNDIRFLLTHASAQVENPPVLPKLQGLVVSCDFFI
jgi:ankyrin repeat protein